MRFSKGALLFSSSRLSNGIDPNQSRFSSFIETPTTPRPILWMFHQPSHYWIGVQVVQLFLQLSRAPYIEIVEPALPEPFEPVPFLGKRKPQLCSCSSSPFLPHHLRGIALRRLADQQVHMLRHDHVSDQQKRIALPHFRKNLHKQVPGPHRLQQRPPLETTECDEVQIFLAVVAPELVFHEAKKSAPFENHKRCGTPSFTQGLYPKWYTLASFRPATEFEGTHAPPASHRCFSGRAHLSAGM